MVRGGKLDKKECNGTPVQEAGPFVGMSTMNTHTRREMLEDGFVNLWEATLETTQTRLRSSFRSICARADADGPVAFLLRVRPPFTARAPFSVLQFSTSNAGFPRFSSRPGR